MPGDESIILEQKKVADKFIASLIENPDIIGVCYLGSIARRFGTRDSDIDIGVFSYERIPELQLGERIVGDWDVEIFNIVLNEGYKNWSEPQREAYFEGELIYDKKGAVNQFLNAALKYPLDYRLTKMIHILFQLGWHGWSYSPIKGTDWKGYNWGLKNDLWIKRSRLDNAFYILSQSINLAIDLVYAINSRWIPDTKWKFIKSFKLSWIPDSWKECMDYLTTGVGLSSEEVWYEKAKVFQSAIDSCYEKIMDELPDDMYMHLIENTDEY